MLEASVFNSERPDIFSDTIEHPSKSYSGLNFLGAYVFNFERLDILHDSIGHPSERLLWFELTRSFRIQFRASRYILELNRTPE